MNENVSFLTLLHDNVPLSYMFKSLARVVEFSPRQYTLDSGINIGVHLLIFEKKMKEKKKKEK